LERYIDVTRGELFFSKGVILVEGDAEKFLLPTLAKLYDPNLDLDAQGITVCSIAGTNFAPYIRLLGPTGLDIPFVVLTDFDPKGAEVSQEDADPDSEGVGNSYGKNRVVNEIMVHLMDSEEWEALSFAKILTRADKYGVFLNTFTFEIDLFKAGAEEEFAEAINGLTSNKKMQERFDYLSLDPSSLDPKQFTGDCPRVSRCRFGQHKNFGRFLQEPGGGVVPDSCDASQQLPI
jgi:putative ATP-dependent endonuclease of OLD family